MAEADVSAKRELHQLVDSLPLKEIKAAKRFLEFLLSRRDENDLMLEALMNAPDDEESLDILETSGLREGLREIARGETRPWDEIKKELGLNQS